KEIIQNIKDKKLRDQEKIITSQDIKSSLNVKGGQVLIQKLFTPEPSLQESNIMQNHVTEISETGGPGKISSEIETGNITIPSIPLFHTSSSMTASSNSEDKIIEEVSRNEDAIASESLPETEIKISISTESHVSDSSKAEGLLPKMMQNIEALLLLSRLEEE
ncbi:8930_t:CDS:2, partial [Paraglomus brasilianum]